MCQIRTMEIISAIVIREADDDGVSPPVPSLEVDLSPIFSHSRLHLDDLDYAFLSEF